LMLVALQRRKVRVAVWQLKDTVSAGRLRHATFANVLAWFSGRVIIPCFL
jgi:hypothetical protein